MDVRKHIYFSGRVQGVGFRYRACYIAQGLCLTGWVKNCYDERVEMEVQGPLVVIEQLIAKLEVQSFIRIDQILMTDLPLCSEYGFTIK